MKQDHPTAVGAGITAVAVAQGTQNTRGGNGSCGWLDIGLASEFELALGEFLLPRWRREKKACVQPDMAVIFGRGTRTSYDMGWLDFLLLVFHFWLAWRQKSRCAVYGSTYLCCCCVHRCVQQL